MNTISIIIPTYNSSPFIKKALDSVICNISSNYIYEVLIIDDCSDDLVQLEKIVASIPNTKIIKKKEKSNAAHSRNIGLKKSTGNYIFFLDSDDNYLSQAFEHRIKLHQRHRAGICFGTFLTNDAPNELSIYHSGSMLDYLFLEKGDARTSTISICREYYKNTDFDNKQNKHQDWGFLIRAEQNAEVIYFDQTPIVNIDESTNTSRMSARLNLNASSYFIERYKLSANHMCMFVRRHATLCIKNSDDEAAKTFRKLLVNRFSQMNTKYKMKAFILYLSLTPVMRPIVKKLLSFR